MAMEERPDTCRGVNIFTTFPVKQVGAEEKVAGLGLGKRGSLVVREMEEEEKG